MQREHQERLTSAILSLKMARNVMRLMSAEAQIRWRHVRAGTMSDADWQKVARKTGSIVEAPLFIDDSPNMSMMEIRAKCRRLKQKHDLRLVVVDYLQLMSSGKKAVLPAEVAELRALKQAGQGAEVLVIATSQLNRGPEQRQDKRPMMSDLRESGSLEQDADRVSCCTEDAYEKESLRAGEADFIVAKHRNGPDGDDHGRVPGSLQPLRRHGLDLEACRVRCLLVWMSSPVRSQRTGMAWRGQ